MRVDFPHRVRRRRRADPTRFVLMHLGRALVAVYFPWLLLTALGTFLNPPTLLALSVASTDGRLPAVAVSLVSWWMELVAQGTGRLGAAAALVVWPYSLVAAPLWRFAHPLAGLLLGPPTAAFVLLSWCSAALPLGTLFGVATGLMLAVLPQPFARPS